ncbi:MAG: FecR family protein, partial [Bacteroidales bacterium]|nr:FecR family protein [Bacteroidales bacterium]
SKLVYPSAFEKGLREVTLEGEAFFDVTKMADTPFRVNTSILDVKVLGTQFNLVANSSRNEFEAALMQGKIEVCSQDNEKPLVTLHPNQVAFLSGGKIVTKIIDFEDQYRWKEGLYCFKNQTIMEIISDLEKYYDVKIVLNNSKLSTSKLTGKFRISDGLDYALRVLQMSAKFTFERDKENGIVYIN